MRSNRSSHLALICSHRSNGVSLTMAPICTIPFRLDKAPEASGRAQHIAVH